MGTDAFVDMLSSLCSRLLPIVGVILLIYLIKLIASLIKTTKELNKTLEEAQDAIDIANSQIQKLDKPLATIGNLCETVDSVQDAANQAIKSSIAIVLNNLDKIQQKIKDTKNHNNTSNVTDAEDGLSKETGDTNNG